LLDRQSAGAEFDNAEKSEEVLAYMPPGRMARTSSATPSGWPAAAVNCPENASTVTIDLKEVGPTYLRRLRV
jgi:long-chain acyl-CoA synthetase